MYVAHPPTHVPTLLTHARPWLSKKSPGEDSVPNKAKKNCQPETKIKEVVVVIYPEKKSQGSHTKPIQKKQNAQRNPAKTRTTKKKKKKLDCRRGSTEKKEAKLKPIK